jgi:chromosome segregation ATPase
MKCGIEAVNSAVGVIWREISRLEEKNTVLEEELSIHDKRTGKINDLSFENDQLKKKLETARVLGKEYQEQIEMARRERDEFKNKFEAAVRSLSESEKALAFYENLSAKQAGTDETHVSIPISAMSNVYVLWDKNDVFCPASMGYDSLEKARAVLDRGVRKDLCIARLVWVRR